jgi:hypothetical protein
MHTADGDCRTEHLALRRTSLRNIFSSLSTQPTVGPSAEVPKRSQMGATSIRLCLALARASYQGRRTVPSVKGFRNPCNRAQAKERKAVKLPLHPEMKRCANCNARRVFLLVWFRESEVVCGRLATHSVAWVLWPASTSWRTTGGIICDAASLQRPAGFGGRRDFRNSARIVEKHNSQ